MVSPGSLYEGDSDLWELPRRAISRTSVSLSQQFLDRMTGRRVDRPAIPHPLSPVYRSSAGATGTRIPSPSDGERHICDKGSESDRSAIAPGSGSLGRFVPCYVPFLAPVSGFGVRQHGWSREVPRKRLAPALRWEQRTKVPKALPASLLQDKEVVAYVPSSMVGNREELLNIEVDLDLRGERMFLLCF